jgi:hypothetical protein
MRPTMRRSVLPDTGASHSVVWKLVVNQLTDSLARRLPAAEIVQQMP